MEVYSADPCPTAMRLGGWRSGLRHGRRGVLYFYGPGGSDLSTAMQVMQPCAALHEPYVP